MSVITDEFAFSLAPDGWNYYRSLIAEYDNDPDIAPERSSFFRFFQDERINAVRYLDDILFIHQPQKRSSQSAFKFYLGTYPWGGLTKADSLVGGTPFGWHYDHIEGKTTRDQWGYRRTLWHKPDERSTLEYEWIYTIQNYDAIKKGYRPLLHGSFPGVALLIRRNGAMRAVIVDGHHRLSCLSYLGFDQITVELLEVVEETNVEQWYYVKRGNCTTEDALDVFNAFFVLNGRERIVYLDLNKSRTHSGTTLRNSSKTTDTRPPLPAGMVDLKSFKSFFR